MSVPRRGYPQPQQPGARRQRQGRLLPTADAGGSRLRDAGDTGAPAPVPRAPYRGTSAEPGLLPASRSPGGQPPSPDLRSRRGRAAGLKPDRLRVVVVEDEAIIALELEMLLTSLGAEVVAMAMSADEAVRLAEAERPDCMTMDIRLQGDRDGVSAAVEIYERFGIRSVFVSAYSDPGTVERGARAHPLGWVPKPIRQDKLEAGLRNLGDQSSDA